MGGTMTSDRTARRPRRLSSAARFAAIFAVPVILLTSCKVSDVTDPIVKPIQTILGIGSNEVTTPKFEIVNGITIQVVIKFDDLSAGLPVTVHLHCAGGTEASATVTLHDSGGISVGQTSFKPTWPAGTDCLVSQEIVKGVDTAAGIITWLDSNDV